MLLIVLALMGCRRDDVETDTGDIDTDAVDTDVVDTGPIVDIDEADREAIEAAAEDDLDGSDASGVQIAVWKGGRIVYQGQVGSAHPDRNVPITPQTLFQVGSDTKKMTALGVLLEEDAGRIGRDTTVAEATGLTLEADADWATQATLHDLLSHQGGLFDYTPWDHAPADSELSNRTHGVFAERQAPNAPPGVTWNYSNPNFSLSGLANEVSAGKPWADVMEDDLFAPLGMDRTFARRSAVEAESDVAAGTGYSGWSDDAFDPYRAGGSWEWGTAEVADCADNAFTRPAGLVWSTATDMATLGAFLIDGDTTILADDLREAVTTKHVSLYPAFDGWGYGYGMMLYDGINLADGYHATKTWTHGGNTLAFTSMTWILPEQGLSISLLSNGYGTDFTGTAVEILERLGDLPAPSTAPAYPATETAHAELVGNYWDPYVGEIVVTDVDGVLQIDMPTFESWGITVSPAVRYEGITDIYTFAAAGTRMELVFVADEAGVYRWARNRLFVGTRQEGIAPRAPIGRSPAELAVGLAEARLSPLVLPR